MRCFLEASDVESACLEGRLLAVSLWGGTHQVWHTNRLRVSLLSHVIVSTPWVWSLCSILSKEHKWVIYVITSPYQRTESLVWRVGCGVVLSPQIQAADWRPEETTPQKTTLSSLQRRYTSKYRLVVLELTQICCLGPNGRFGTPGSRVSHVLVWADVASFRQVSLPEDNFFYSHGQFLLLIHRCPFW